MSSSRRGREAEPSALQFGARNNRQRLVRLLDEVSGSPRALADAESQWSGWLAAVAPEHRASARNLVHYWAIRQRDLRGLQIRLAALRIVVAGPQRAPCRGHPVVDPVGDLGHARRRLAAARTSGVAHRPGLRIARRRTDELLGPAPVSRPTRIMVTLPSAAATDPEVVAELVKRGMNIARINCAHDDAEAWRAMARHVRQAAESSGRPCLIAMDLAGPKLRTGPLEPGPRAVKLRPRKNALGKVVAPARAWLTASEDPTDPPDAGMPLLPVPRRWLGRRRAGDILQLRDTRGSKRRLVLTNDDQTSGSPGWIRGHRRQDDLSCDRDSPERRRHRRTHRTRRASADRAEPRAASRRHSPAHPGLFTRAGGHRDDTPRIGCTLSEAFDHARTGDTVHLDDGKISGEIVFGGSRRDCGAHRPARTGGVKAQGRQGNQRARHRAADPGHDGQGRCRPGRLSLNSLIWSRCRSSAILPTSSSYSASWTASAMIAWASCSRSKPGKRSTICRNLCSRPCSAAAVGVMIARGDLAVECGYERLAESAGGDPLAVRGRAPAGDLGDPGARTARQERHCRHAPRSPTRP